jgi:signal peptidase II
MRHKYLLLLAVFGFVLVADQATKYFAVARLTLAFEHAHLSAPLERLAGFYTLKNLDNEPAEPAGVDLRGVPVVVIPGYWQHRYVENPGAAWGLLSRVSDTWRVPFFHVISVLAILIIVAFYRRLEADQRLMALSLSLVLGGALGNYVDRLVRGYVIDFIDWHWRNDPRLHWPTFNVADSAICVGVFLMLVETLFARRPPPTADVVAPPAVSDAAPPNPGSPVPPDGGAPQA